MLSLPLEGTLEPQLTAEQSSTGSHWNSPRKIHHKIQHHQTSSTTNAKGTYLSGEHKRRKGPTKTNPKQLRKWS